ncbi:MAG: hypothetical protein H7Z40_19575, partial [Phycisphaerae bacterium]|nr:hypothetical protein [Gemmatimonadaceae bacterium]
MNRMNAPRLPSPFSLSFLPLMTSLVVGLVVGSTSAAHAQLAPSRIGGRLATRGDGTIVMFARGMDGSMSFSQRIGFTGTGSNVWEAWRPLGGFLNSQPVTVMAADSRMSVVVRGGDNQLYEKRELSARSKTFGEWVTIPQFDAAGAAVPPFEGDPAQVRTSNGRLAVFAVAN